MDSKTSSLITQIVASISACQTSQLIQPIEAGTGDWKNELVLFIKPESFMVGQPDAIRASVELVFERLAAFDAHVHGILIVGGQVLDEKEIMNQHYGFINRLSRLAAQILEAEDRQKIAAALEIGRAHV